MSTHDRAWARHVLEEFPAYAVLYVPYTLKSKAQPADLNSIDRTQLYEPPDQEWWLQDRRPGLLELVRKNDVGVITTKPFSAGLIFSAARQEFGRPDGATDADRELARLTLAYILAHARRFLRIRARAAHAGRAKQPAGYAIEARGTRDSTISVIWYVLARSIWSR